MRVIRALTFAAAVTLGLVLVAMSVYTAYVARLWFRAMKAGWSGISFPPDRPPDRIPIP